MKYNVEVVDRAPIIVQLVKVLIKLVIILVLAYVNLDIS